MAQLQGGGAGRPGGDRDGAAQSGLHRDPRADRGRTGARLVDPGNFVQASSGTTLVSITQIKPIYVSFTLPATNLDAIRQSQANHRWRWMPIAGDDKTLLGKGTLSFIDNHVDTTTGTIALKGTFANADERLWPGEFVNAQADPVGATERRHGAGADGHGWTGWRLRLCDPPGQHGAAARRYRWPAGRTGLR